MRPRRHICKACFTPHSRPNDCRRITKGPNAREVIQKCYDFALSHASQDKDSYDIWQDYINFLKAGEVRCAQFTSFICGFVSEYFKISKGKVFATLWWRRSCRTRVLEIARVGLVCTVRMTVHRGAVCASRTALVQCASEPRRADTKPSNYPLPILLRLSLSLSLMDLVLLLRPLYHCSSLSMHLHPVTHRSATLRAPSDRVILSSVCLCILWFAVDVQSSVANEPSQTKTTWEEQQKMDAVRRAYQQAVQIPMENVKRLWEDYQDFENGLNKITVSRLVDSVTCHVAHILV